MEIIEYDFNQYIQDHSIRDLSTNFENAINNLKNCSKIIKDDHQDFDEIKKIKERIYSNAINFIKAIKTNVYLQDIDYAYNTLRKENSQLQYCYIVKEKQNVAQIREKLIKIKWENFADQKRIVRKTLEHIPISLLLNENEALICFPFKDGRVNDNQGLYGTKKDNPSFYDLCINYFEDMWELGKDFDIDKIDDVFKAFGHSLRRKILMKLNENHIGWENNKLAKELNTDSASIANGVKSLSMAGLAETRDGFFYITLLGRLQVEHMKTTSFFMRRGDYFSKHRFNDLPDIFRLSMVQLSQAKLIDNFFEINQLWEQIIYNTVEKNKDTVEKNKEKYVKAIKTQIATKHIEIVSDLYEKGLSYYYILPENVKAPGNRDETIRKTRWNELVKEGKIYRKMMKENYINLILNENEALICFPNQHGETDLGKGLYCKDERSLIWCQDYFNYMWNKSVEFDENKII